MRSKSIILAGLAWTATILGVNAQVTCTAKYDALPTSTPTNFTNKNLQYTGFQVVNAQHGLTPRSSPHMLMLSNPFQASIFGGEFTPLSLYIGCAGLPGSTYDSVPLPCSVTLTSDFPSGIFTVTTYTMNFTPDNNSSGNSTLHFVDLSKANLGGSVLYFALSAGKGATQVYIDNLVFSDDNASSC